MCIYIFIYIYNRSAHVSVCVTVYIEILWSFGLLKLYALQFYKVGW